MSLTHLGPSKINFLYQQIFEQGSIDAVNWNEFFLLHFNGPFLRDVLFRIPSEQLPTLSPLFTEMTSQCVAVIGSSRNIKFYNACSTLTTTVFTLANRLGVSPDFLEIVFSDQFDVTLRKLASSLANVLKNENSIYLKIIAMDAIIFLHTTCTELTQNSLIPYFFCEEFSQVFEAIFRDSELRSTLGADTIKILALLKTKERSVKSLAELKPVLDDNLAIMGFLQIFSTWLRISSDKFLFSIGQMSDELDAIETFSKKSEYIASVGIRHNEDSSYEPNFSEEVEFLLAFYNVLACSRKIMGSLLTAPPAECFSEDGAHTGSHEHSVVCSLLTFASYVFSDLKEEPSKQCAKVTLLLLLRIADDGYIQNAFHDVALSAAVPLYIKPQLHRPGQLDYGNSNQTLATTLLSLLSEFLRSHLSRNFLFDHYQIAVSVIHRIVVHEKKSRLRTGCWKQLFLGLMSVLQYLGSNEQHLAAAGDVFRLATQVMVVVNLFITYGDVLLPDASSYDFLYYEIVRQHGVFTRLNHAACTVLQKQSLEGCERSVAPLKNDWPSKLINQLMNALSIVNHITPKLTDISMKQGTLSEEQVLKVVQESFDSLNLKLYDGLDNFECFDFQQEEQFLIEVGQSVVKNYWDRRIPIDTLIVYRQPAMVAANGVCSRKGFYTPLEGQPNAEREVMLRIQDQYHVQFANYEDFYRWTCDNYAEFWEVVLKYCDVKLGSPYKQVIDKTKTIADIPAWFEGAQLNYAENCLRKGEDLQTAIIVAAHDGSLTRYDFRTLRNDVAFIASALLKFGVTVGDHVCGYLPNTYETTVAMLATASIGAVWSSASVDFGVVGVCDRFRQVAPKILFTVDGVTYKGKKHCLQEKVNAIVKDLTTIEHIVVVPFLNATVDLKGYESREKYVSWTDFKHCVSTKPLSLEFAQVPFSHPLFVLFSSGTTGTPKAMVHTVGGTLLKHVEEHIVQANMKSSDTILFYTTCGWMMWNWLMSVLYTGATLVLYDESPLEPDPHILIKICASTKATILGMGAKIYDEYTKRGEDFYSMYDLQHLRLVLSTGSPLKSASFDYINEYIRPGVVIGSISGGTDIVGCFMGCTLNLPVVSGECQHLYLGMDVHAFSHNGTSVEDEQGELVCIKPFPSMPSHFIGDAEGKRYKRAYFEKYPDIWAHGDFCLINSKTKGVTMLGRSDTTLNRGGVRIGTAEIYSVVDAIQEIEDCIVAGQNIPEADDEHIILFVKMRNGYTLDAEIISTIKSRIRTQMSPRHVPNAFYAVPDIPYTNSGKKVELAVKQIINGENVEKASSLRNPEALDHFVAFRKP